VSVRKIIGETVVGSHIWKMNHANSDLDLWRIYVVDTKDLLKGIAKTKSKHKKIKADWRPEDELEEFYGIDTDIKEHEAGNVVVQLLKGNINYIVGVLSPIVRINTPIFQRLRDLTRTHISKNCFHSIRGKAKNNYKNFILSGKDTSLHKCNQIMRVIQFGIRILHENEVEFRPTYKTLATEIPGTIEWLEWHYNHSDLPEKVPEEPFREWLLKLRLRNL